MRKAIVQCMVGGPRFSESGAMEADFVFPAHFAGFAGHFPDNPLLPAVVEVIAAQALIDACTGTDTTLVGLSRAKFLDVIRPDHPVRILVTVKDAGRYSVSLTRPDGGNVARFDLRCD